MKGLNNMRAKSIIATIAVFLCGLLLIACARGGGIGGGGGYINNLKQIEQQHSGDYIVTVLSDSGQLKKGANKFALEFRRGPENRLTSVGDIQVSSTMPMPGTSPMIAQSSAIPTDTP